MTLKKDFNPLRSSDTCISRRYGTSIPSYLRLLPSDVIFDHPGLCMPNYDVGMNLYFKWGQPLGRISDNRMVVACGQDPNQIGHMVFTEPFVHYKPVRLV
jgi:hypothetical protein